MKKSKIIMAEKIWEAKSKDTLIRGEGITPAATHSDCNNIATSPPHVHGFIFA